VPCGSEPCSAGTEGSDNPKFMLHLDVWVVEHKFEIADLYDNKTRKTKRNSHQKISSSLLLHLIYWPTPN
jgi:hypothetical protein